MLENEVLYKYNYTNGSKDKMISKEVIEFSFSKIDFRDYYINRLGQVYCFTIEDYIPNLIDIVSISGNRHYDILVALNKYDKICLIPYPEILYGSDKVFFFDNENFISMCISDSIILSLDRNGEAYFFNFKQKGIFQQINKIDSAGFISICAGMLFSLLLGKNGKVYIFDIKQRILIKCHDVSNVYQIAIMSFDNKEEAIILDEYGSIYYCTDLSIPKFNLKYSPYINYRRKPTNITIIDEEFCFYDNNNTYESLDGNCVYVL